MAGSIGGGRMHKVLITGVTGFVGSHLADYHLARDAEVYGFRRYHLSPMAKVAHIEDRIRWIDCDMTDQKAVAEAVRAVMPDKIFHMAAQSFVSPSWNHPSLYMDANYKMTVNLFEACLTNDINPRILLPGSGEEFGEIFEDELPIREETILRPVNPYAVTKIAQDLIGYVYHRSYGMDIVRTRAFNHEGPRRSKVFGIPSYAYQVSRIERGLQEPVVKVGHIDDRRNFTHVLDMVEAYSLAIDRCEPGELYLIGSDSESDIRTFREAVEGLIDRSETDGIRYEVDSRYVRPTQVPFLICDPSKFVSLTGWQPKLGFERILDDTLGFWRDQ
jgi:GDP-4-dehydro-6-deoxy-D-mannose reductase